LLNKLNRINGKILPIQLKPFPEYPVLQAQVKLP